MAANNMIVQNNIAAQNVHRNMKNVGAQQMKASERLSSGYRINRASDDAAGLAISEKMRGQIRGLNMSSKNVDDAVSLVKTAEGGMQGIDDMLHRIRELLDFTSNDTNENNAVGTGDRQKVQDEIDQLVEEIDSMSTRVEYNKKKLIDGSWQDTKSQLSNATDLVNTLKLDQTKASSAQAAAATTNAVDQAALTDALAALNGGLDSAGNTINATFSATGVNSAGAVYTSAISTLETARGVYQQAMSAYQSAKTDLTDVASALKLGSDIGSWSSATIAAAKAGASTALVAKLETAIQAYASASMALGVDELGLANAGIDNPTALAAVGTTATTAANGMSSAIPTDINAANAAATQMASGQLAVWNAAQATFAGQETVYQAAVTKTNRAQTTFDASTKAFDEATRDVSLVDTKLKHANVSLLAASEAHNASTAKPLHFQVGANGGQSLFMSIGSLKSDTLGIGDGNGNTNIDVLKDTGADITATIDVLDQALSYVTTERSKLGAAVNRMEYTQQSLDITSENLSDAEARIRDADMAEEMMNKTKADTLQQVAVAMMSQANQQPQSILQLLR